MLSPSNCLSSFLLRMKVPINSEWLTFPQGSKAILLIRPSISMHLCSLLWAFTQSINWGFWQRTQTIWNSTISSFFSPLPLAPFVFLVRSVTFSFSFIFLTWVKGCHRKVSTWVFLSSIVSCYWIIMMRPFLLC